MNNRSAKKQSFPIGALILLFIGVLGAVNTLPLLQYLGDGYNGFSIILSVIEVLAALLVSVLMLFKRRDGVLLFPIAILILTYLISFLSSWRNFSALALAAMWVVIALTVLAAYFSGMASLKRGKRALTVILVIASILYGAVSVVNATSVFVIDQTYTETTVNDYSGKSANDADSDTLKSQGKQYGFTALAATGESESESESESENDKSEDMYYYAGDISNSFITIFPSGNGEEQTSVGYSDSTVIFTPSGNGNFFFSSSNDSFFSTDESGNIIYYDKNPLDKDTLGKYNTQIQYVGSGAPMSPLGALLTFLYSVGTTGAYIAAILLIKKWLDEDDKEKFESAYEDNETEAYEEMTEE